MTEEIAPTQGLADAMYPPTYVGPCWAVDADDEWLLPEYTLGWEIAGWCAQWLTTPEGEPWIFTNEQLRLVLWLYEVDAHGERVYRKSVIQRAKGWGLPGQRPLRSRPVFGRIDGAL